MNKSTAFNVWVRYFVWNFKGTLPHKISYPYIERYDFYTTWKFQELLDLRAHTCFWNAPSDKCNYCRVRRRHLHCSGITACALCDLTPSLFQLCLHVFPISVRQLFEYLTACQMIKKKLLSYSQDNGLPLPKFIRHKISLYDLFPRCNQAAILYLRCSEGVFVRHYHWGFSVQLGQSICGHIGWWSPQIASDCKLVAFCRKHWLILYYFFYLNQPCGTHLFVS